MSVKNIALESSLMSEEVNEVLGAGPSFMMRWGNILLFAVILLFLTLSGLIRFPDIIGGKATIVPLQAPASVIIDQGGVQAALVQNGQLVHQGQALLLRTGGDTIAAPVAGKVVFERSIDSRIIYTKPTLLLSILPEHGDYITTVTLPSAGAGKVQIGQEVSIHLNDYPSGEFGKLAGKVLSRPLPAGNGAVSIDIQLKDGNISSYHKPLDIYKAMDGRAEIVTANKRLIQRILSFLN
ncbi:HlyD family efflux transporter periplasmic adaptor subunit [Chitinophaga sp. sic0106]|uniref:HlyD family efflux transporter periplasmic adaptor subunit n=1 Tax=Chitinophaga sp. sic0106 TaxID=2854785 RepID=UPI001C476641|nr:HlyD family efflux transporter periplasmic adaptor subunit [Chitinophaga sp. sic0106]MBV7529432.1 HlyD family secretion protein [Chitinophaga sp. sic0106]